MLRYLEKFNLGGVEQWALIRGENSENPLLLFLHGGPGFAQMSFAPAFQKSLEQYFLVVNWDQRGSGKSFSKQTPPESLTLEQYVFDTQELVTILLKRFNKEKLFLVGHSWGSTLGMFTIQKHPELFYAFIGCGFGIDFEAGERLSIKYLLDAAIKANNVKAQKELEQVKFPLKLEQFDRYIDVKAKWMNKFGGYFEANVFKLMKRGLLSLIFSDVYTFSDKLKWIQGIKFSKQAGRHIIPTINLFEQISEIKIPIYFFIGHHDYHTPFELVKKYYDSLNAPSKEWIWFEKSAHSPVFEEADKFADVLINMLLKDEKTKGSSSCHP